MGTAAEFRRDRDGSIDYAYYRKRAARWRRRVQLVVIRSCLSAIMRTVIGRRPLRTVRAPADF